MMLDTDSTNIHQHNKLTDVFRQIFEKVIDD